MIGLPSGTRIWLAGGMTDMRRGFDGMAAMVQEKLGADPFGDHVFVFRGRRGDLIKLLSGGMVMAFVSSPNVWSTVASSGHRRPKAPCT